MPELGDKVMCYRSETGEVYVLHVLQRQQGVENTLSFHGNTRVDVTGGAMSVNSQKSINFVAKEGISNVGRDFSVTSQSANLVSSDIDVKGKTAKVRLSKLSSVVTMIESVADNLVQTLKTSFRMIKDHEHVKAGNVLHDVDNAHITRSEGVFITARKDVKVDAERIHMG